MTEQLPPNVDDILKGIDSSPFSEQGFKALNGYIARYIDDLINESAIVARRGKADTISASHVDEAAAHLVNSSTRRVYRHLGTIGGTLLGTGLAQFVTMMSEVQPEFTSMGVGISITFGIIGAFLVALHMAKD